MANTRSKMKSTYCVKENERKKCPFPYLSVVRKCLEFIFSLGEEKNSGKAY